MTSGDDGAGDDPAADLVVEVEVAAADAELTAGRLWELGATAVEVRDGRPRVLLVASMPGAEACTRAAAELGGRVAAIEDRSWRDAWRAFAEPVRVADLVVAPAGKPVTLPGDGTVIEIDPGGCFGSGTHPSTRLILAELVAKPPGRAAVVDVGTGSGILSVAAARLGAARVVAIDIDPAAVAVTRANAVRNGVADRISASTATVDELDGEFDVALVNVTAAVHRSVGPALSERVRPGGRVLVAGLLPGQWPHVAAAYAGCALDAELELEGWVGAALRR